MQQKKTTKRFVYLVTLDVNTGNISIGTKLKQCINHDALAIYAHPSWTSANITTKHHNNNVHGYDHINYLFGTDLLFCLKHGWEQLYRMNSALEVCVTYNHYTLSLAVGLINFSLFLICSSS